MSAIAFALKDPVDRWARQATEIAVDSTYECLTWITSKLEFAIIES
jgi:hypothetical protein